MAADPGNDMPSTSHQTGRFMVEVARAHGIAVAVVDGAAEATSLMKAVRSILPAANSSRAFQDHTVPDPILLPSAQALSIGPTDNAIAGISTVAAAIKQAGVVLSQPMVSTTPSMG